jgi:SAM-dependent methyltransferase
MDSYSSETYGDQWAGIYDELFPLPGSEVIDFLVARAQGGPVLELAVGTGRVALPLAETGLEVHGIEISRAMIAQLRRKDQAFPIVASDMTDFEADSAYPLVFLGFNTLFGPLEAERQRGIFQSTATALQPNGSFVIDCFVPDLDRFVDNQTVRTREVRTDRLQVDYSIHEPDRQVIRTMVDVRWTDGRSVLLPVFVRYLWPDQIDRMATDVGLELEQRYEWYDETPFTGASARHVSVYRKA